LRQQEERMAAAIAQEATMAAPVAEPEATY